MAEITHACPVGDSAFTPCCGRSPFELLGGPALWEMVAERLDAENHDNLCACILYPERCVTYGDKRPWSHSAERAVEIAVEIIYGLDADTAERVPLFNDDGTLRSVYEVRERAADIKNRSTK